MLGFILLLINYLGLMEGVNGSHTFDLSKSNLRLVNYKILVEYSHLLRLTKKALGCQIITDSLGL